MSAIKLPVTVEPFGLEFCVLDADRTSVTLCLRRERASQIATALNMHDELVNVLDVVKGSLVGADYDMVIAALSKAGATT